MLTRLVLLTTFIHATISITDFDFLITLSNLKYNLQLQKSTDLFLKSFFTTQIFENDITDKFIEEDRIIFHLVGDEFSQNFFTYVIEGVYTDVLSKLLGMT